MKNSQQNKIKYFETFNLLKHIVHDSKCTLHQFWKDLKKKNILKLNLSFQRFTARNGACNDVFYYVK